MYSVFGLYVHYCIECAHWLRPRQLPPSPVGLIYESAIGQPRKTTSLRVCQFCQLLADSYRQSTKSLACRWGEYYSYLLIKVFYKGNFFKSLVLSSLFLATKPSGKEIYKLGSFFTVLFHFPILENNLLSRIKYILHWQIRSQTA
jgi:hypothetical protein